MCLYPSKAYRRRKKCTLDKIFQNSNFHIFLESTNINAPESYVVFIQPNIWCIFSILLCWRNNANTIYSTVASKLEFAIKIAKDKIGKFTKNWTVCKLKLHSKILCFTEMYAKNKEILYSGHPRNFDILVRNKSQGRSTIGSHQVIDFIISIQPRIIILKNMKLNS